jgi:DNA-binding HxlR family transcriptional regulator
LGSRQMTLVTRPVPAPGRESWTAPALEAGDPRSGETAQALAERPPALALAMRSKSPVEITAGLLRGRWTAIVLWHLFWGGKRFYQLVREVEGIPRRALAHELEELERLGIVERRVQHLGPTKVEYSLTRLGDSLKIVVGAMYEWGLVAMRHPAGRPWNGEERPDRGAP